MRLRRRRRLGGGVGGDCHLDDRSGNDDKGRRLVVSRSARRSQDLSYRSASPALAPSIWTRASSRPRLRRQLGKAGRFGPSSPERSACPCTSTPMLTARPGRSVPGAPRKAVSTWCTSQSVPGSGWERSPMVLSLTDDHIPRWATCGLPQHRSDSSPASRASCGRELLCPRQLLGGSRVGPGRARRSALWAVADLPAPDPGAGESSTSPSVW